VTLLTDPEVVIFAVLTVSVWGLIVWPKQ